MLFYDIYHKKGVVMASVFNFYLSRVIGNELITKNDEVIGKVKDFIVDFNYVKPMVKALQIKSEGKVRNIDFSEVEIKKFKNKFVVYCNDLKDIEIPSENTILLNKWVIDRQIVDINGRKVVRVNDLRLTTVSTGTYLLAVDVGLEGLLRRLGLALIVKSILAPLNKSIPTKLILWDDVETIDTSHAGIKLSKTYTKLHTLHPSDLADIIEDLDRNTQTAIFKSLDDEKAADVLEELEADAQKNILESISLEKAADVLEKMPADEVADILDELEQDKA